MRIASVVKGYRIDPLEVLQADGEQQEPIARAIVAANSGIIISHGIAHVIDAITALRGHE